MVEVAHSAPCGSRRKQKVMRSSNVNILKMKSTRRGATLQRAPSTSRVPAVICGEEQRGAAGVCQKYRIQNVNKHTGGVERGVRLVGRDVTGRKTRRFIIGEGQPFIVTRTH